MILSFINLVDTSTITSSNESLNYPSTNLQDQALKVRYQSSIDYDNIIITLDKLSLVKDFFYGFTNATFMRIYFWNDSELVYQFDINNPDSEIDAYHFIAIYCTEIEIYIEGPLGVYLGGVNISYATLFPDPIEPWNEPYQDNSLTSESLDGQSLSDYIKPLRVYNWNFAKITLEQKNNYIALYNNLGVGQPFWLDPFHNDHTFMKPLYAKMTQPINPNKDGMEWRFNLNVKEAR